MMSHKNHQGNNKAEKKKNRESEQKDDCKFIAHGGLHQNIIRLIHRSPQFHYEMQDYTYLYFLPLPQ